jgi:hypothetical protein
VNEPNVDRTHDLDDAEQIGAPAGLAKATEPVRDAPKNKYQRWPNLRLRWHLTAWGADESQRWMWSPADARVPNADEHWVRSIHIEAPKGLIWKWLCQLRIAPYSYDWIDNFGRRSPDQLTSGLDQLADGQSALGIFRIVDFSRDEQVTMQLAWFHGKTLPYARSYTLTSEGQYASRLDVHIRGRYPSRLPKLVGRSVLTAVCAMDFLMSRRQLSNLKLLAERDSRT